MNKHDKNAIIGVYETHLEAIQALKVLQAQNFNMKHVVLLGKGEAVKEIDGVHTWEEATTKGAEVGAIVGGALGILAGLSLIAVPGLGGLLYVGGVLGATLGGVEGASVGALGGGVLGSIFGSKYGTEGEATGKSDEADYKKYKKEIEAGKFLIVVHGPKEEVEKGHEILLHHATHEHISSGITAF